MKKKKTFKVKAKYGKKYIVDCIVNAVEMINKNIGNCWKF